MERTEIAIRGMSCGHCVARVDRALGRLAGVEVQAVEVGSASVGYDPRRISVDRIARAIEREGYATEVVDGRS